MRRAAAIIGVLGAAALVLFGLGSREDGGTYEVRAIFDNGNFLVTGEQVRVAGATVGSVDEVDVTMPGEWANRDRSENPGKAVVVMKITDSGFQDFRQDASCLIRPQSLLGEKYVDCDPTQPRPPASAPPPPLAVIPDGQPGAGQRFLPLQSNLQEVDLDLVNNIMREPFADRFRLILNSLGAGLAARGKTLDAIIERADPALRQTDRVLAILARQNRQLAQLAKDGDTVLQPLARERQHFAGFINNANIAAEATAERSQDLEAGFQRFPRALRELRLTMSKLREFSDQATPVFAEFRAGAPAIARATEALGPFAHATTPALTSLGKAAEQSREPIIRSDPLLVKVRDLARKGAPGSKLLARLLGNLRETGFFKQFMKFLFNTTGGINGYDQFGHFLRARLEVTGCTALLTVRLAGCDAHFGAPPVFKQGPPTGNHALLRYLKGQAKATGQPLGATSPNGSSASGSPPSAGVALDAEGDPVGGGVDGSARGAIQPRGNQRSSLRAARDLLDTVIGRQRFNQEGRR